SEESSLQKTPDRRVRETIELLFEKVVEIGSVRQTLLWFQEHGLQVPAHTARSEVQWKRPGYGCFYRLLTNRCMEERTHTARVGQPAAAVGSYRSLATGGSRVSNGCPSFPTRMRAM